MLKTVAGCLAAILVVNVSGAQDVPQRVNIVIDGQGTTAEVIVVPAQPVVIPADMPQFPPPSITPLPNPNESIPVQPVPVPVLPAPGRRGRSRMVPTLPKEYTSKDKNGDGQIGMYEWERTKYSEFIKLDKNGDGFLTPQELTARGNSISARIRGGALERDALPNPGNLSAYGQKVGETFLFSVTGRIGGSVYGTGTYTTDSDLATVAVHAGILKDGEKGVVQVTIVESPNQFAGTTANGVTSTTWQAYPSAYTVK